MLVKLIGMEKDLDLTNADSLDSATVVRIVNSSATAQTVTVKESSTPGANNVASLTLAGGESVHLQKAPAHALVASSVVKAVKIAHAN